METMIKTVRTTSKNHDFHDLIRLLDEDLLAIYGDIQKQYSRFNRVDMLNTVVLAYDDRQVAGCGCFRIFESGTVEIKRMYVKPSYRGRGISKLILSELEKWAKEEGFERALLETGKKQLEAVGLYHAMGYTDIPNYGHYEKDENSICMIKNLK
jgi:putative acetyltransferase